VRLDTQISDSIAVIAQSARATASADSVQHECAQP